MESGSDPLVVLQHPAKSLATNYMLVSSNGLILLWPFSGEWAVLLPLMRSRLIVEFNVLLDDEVEVVDAKGDESIQALMF